LDISDARRVKDSQGRYFCPSCYARPAARWSGRTKAIILGGALAVLLIAGICLYRFKFRAHPAIPDEANTAVTDSAIHGKLAFIVKGEATLFLDNQKIGTAKSEAGILLPLTLRKGDILSIRAKSDKVYRSFRIGFIPDAGKPYSFSGVKLLNGQPDMVAIGAVENAPAAPKGRTTPELDPFWTKQGLSDQDGFVGLPDKGRLFVFAVLIK
jgi:hypothetical protein